MTLLTVLGAGVLLWALCFYRFWALARDFLQIECRACAHAEETFCREHDGHVEP